MATLTVTDTSKQCSITNNSGKDVVITLNVPKSETTGAGATVNSSSSLEVLKTTDGNTIIKNGSSGTVTLDHTYEPGGDATGYVQQYDLIVSDSTWLYPLAVIPEAQQTTGYPAQTVPKDNTAITQAAAFYQTLIAYPDSGLAKDYASALKAAQDAAVAKADGSQDSASAAADAMEAAVNGFFRSKTEYSQVTLTELVAIDNYYNSLPAVWSQYKAGLSYYLYGSDGTAAGFAGMISLAMPGTIDITKPNGGYTCTFAPPRNPADTSSTDVDATKATTLIYVDGVFTDDAQAAQPAIALRGSFLLQSSLTGKDSDNKIIIVLTGNVRGTSCVGFDGPQTAPATASQQATATGASSLDRYWDVLIHPKNQQQLIISVMTLVGAVLLLPAIGAAVYGVYRAIKYKAARREALTKQIVEYTLDEFNQREANALLDKTIKIDLRFGQWLGDFYVEFNPANIEGYDRVLQNDTLANKLIKALELQRDGLREALKYSAAMDQTQVTSINKSLETIKDSIGTLSTSRRTELETVLPKALSNYKEVTRTVMDVYFNLEAVISAEAKALIIKNSDLSQQISKDVEESFNADANEVKNEDPLPADHFSPVES
jgi:hypothetical protein